MIPSRVLHSLHIASTSTIVFMAAPMIANKQLAQKLSTIARSWVIDPFRPNLQLKTFLESLAAHPRLTTQAVSAARSLRDNDITKKVYMT